MDTRQKTKILADIPYDALNDWVQRIQAHADVKVIKPPKMGLIMMRGQETVEQTVFNVGEVLVTDCTVSVDDQLGYGILLQNEPERAMALALLDAVSHSNDKKWEAFHADMDLWLQQQEVHQNEEWLKEFSRINRTQVDFNLLEETDVD